MYKYMCIDNFFMITKSLLGGNEVVYVSTPITTGERFINWYESVGKQLDKEGSDYANKRAESVICPNIRDVKEYIKKIKKTSNKVIIDPTNLENGRFQWSQNEFYQFWDRVIKEVVKEIIFLDGWEYSVGCCCELLSAVECNINMYSQNGRRLSVEEALIKIKKSVNIYEANQLKETKKINEILEKIQKYCKNKVCKTTSKDDDKNMKDEKLDFLITNEFANIAQFVSFEPNLNLTPRFVHINNLEEIANLSARDLIEKLILSAPSKSVNIRSFSSKIMKGNKLVLNKGIDSVDEILTIIKENALDGKYSIVNENISIFDSGVSGVALGDVIEFSPEDTPKCVEKDGVCSLPREIAFKIFEIVYGFLPDIKFDTNCRVEFSIHPSRQGVKKQHTLVWEYEYYDKIDYEKKISWPNRFSKFIGDKVFGLLIANSLGIMVPRTTVISRKVAPFIFGVETGLNEKWIRTCPIRKEPGKYFTGSDWTDPFKLMMIEESKGSQDINLASIISQDAVEAVFSGASFVRAEEKDDLIEGVVGKGDRFMVGEQGEENLPEKVIEAVKSLNNQLRCYYKQLGEVSIEWVFDGKTVWLVQLNQLKVKQNNNNVSYVIVQGNPSHYDRVFVKDGLDELRNKIDMIKDQNIGIELIGNIGITSHFGDLLRLSNIPSILISEK